MPINWNVSIKAQPSVPANWLVAAVYDATAPLVLIDHIVLPKPYGGTANITFLNLDTIVYDFKLYESVDMSPAGTVLNTFSFQPSLGTITVIRDDIMLKAGETEDFDIGGTEYDDVSLVGWVWELERIGMGTMEKGVDYNQKLTGGFDLLLDGDQFGEGEKFNIHFQPQVTSSPSTGSGSSGNIINGTEILDSDIVLDNTYMKKACFLVGVGDSFTVTLPLLSTVGENQMITFISEGGTHVNGTIETAGADSIKYKKDLLPHLIMGQSEALSLFKANGVWNVFNADGNFLIVGEVAYSYKKTDLINGYFANGTILSRITYARLWEHVSSLEVGLVVADSQWTITQNVNGRVVFVNRGKFTTGDGSTTFRVPEIYITGNLKAVDGTTRLPCSFEADMVGPHDHELIVPASATSRTHNGQGRFTGGSELTEPVDMNPVDTEENAGTETKEANFGVYALLRI